METEFEASTDVIAMKLTIAAVEAWVRNGSSDLHTGEDVGREVGAIYREIHAAVCESVRPYEDDEEFDDDVTTVTARKPKRTTEAEIRG